MELFAPLGAHFPVDQDFPLRDADLGLPTGAREPGIFQQGLQLDEGGGDLDGMFDCIIPRSGS